jgi:DNA modification methylase
MEKLVPYFQDEFGVLYCGDVKEVIKSLEKGQFDMSISSPPYWAQRDYSTEQQLGQEDSFKRYVRNLAHYYSLVGNLIKDDGTLWINIDDTYYGSNKGSGLRDKNTKGNKNNKGSIIENATRFSKLGELKRKSLCLIPQRFSIEMTDEYGWILRNYLIWNKPNAMPEGAKDRFTNDYEPMLLFSKSEKYKFNTQHEPYLTKMNRWGGDKLNANGVSDYDEGTGQKTYRKRNLRPNPLGRIKRTTWFISTESKKGLKHYATYPEKLIEIPILAGSDIGDIVFDPFFGAGTTGIVSERLGRRWSGIELNPEYCKTAIDRILKERK